jgi:hypothetical protein
MVKEKNLRGKKTKFSLLLLIFCFVFTLVGFGEQDNGEKEEEKPLPPPPTYILGNQNIVINLGPFIPMFFVSFKDGSVLPANLYVGAKLGFQWQSYLSNEFSIGIELNGALSLSPNFNILWMLPLGVKASYTIHAFPFEIPISLTMGMCLESYLQSTRIDFFTKPEVSFYWKFDPAWALGLSVGYLLIPQLANEKQEDIQSGQSFLGNFLEITAGFCFHF